MFLLVNYKVRSFYEKDTGTAGADVIIYSDTGDVVDTILITTESTYNDLAKQLEGIDEKYLDKQDVLTILQNASDEIVEINATYLNGQSADFYAKNNHDHNTMYAPLSHVDVNASESTKGHVKIINNLSRGSFVNGEALSAYQGKLLSDRLDAFIRSASNWITQSVPDGTLFVNSTLRLCELFWVKSVKLVNETKLLTSGCVPVGYRPKGHVKSSGLRGYDVLYVNTDGGVYGRSSTEFKNPATVSASFLWHY